MSDLDHELGNRLPPPSDLDPEADLTAIPVCSHPLRRIAFATGSAALLIAMVTDALAVAGRHLGITLLGAIEIVQASVVVAATSAILIATIDNAHARVRILVEQVATGTAAILERVANLFSAIVCLVLVAGSLWLASDLWSGQELTEVLGIPLRWLRLFWIAGALLTAIMFARPFKRRAR